MSSFSSASSLRVPPSPASPSRDQHRSDVAHASRPRIPSVRTSTSHLFRHPQQSSSAGYRARSRDGDQQACLPSSSKSHDFFRDSVSDRSGHASAFVPRTPPSDSKVRTHSRARSSCNEVSPVVRMGGLGRPTPAFQAHQSRHAPNGCTTRSSSLVFAQVTPVPLNEPPSLSSSLTSPAPSLTIPPTPHSQRSPVRSRKQIAFVTPSASSSSLRSESGLQARREQHTSSPSPLSHASRSSRSNSHRLSPLAFPHTFSIRRGLVPLRARPTLAMSMQIHAPSPVLSTRPMSPALPPSARPRSRSRARSTSRPSSPHTSSVPLPPRPPMPRPPSRSERLLRDTLRRAEEQERLMNPPPSLFGLSPPAPNPSIPPSVAQMFGPCRLPAAEHGGRRHRRHTSASLQSDSSCDYFEAEPLDEDSQEDDEDNEWPWRGNSGESSSSEHGYSHAYYPARPAKRADVVAYGTPASPSPARIQLQRAAKSSPNVPRRHSHSQSLSYVPTHPPSRSSPEADQLTPHDAVLRSKLEGVLKNAKAQDRRTRSVERRDPDSGFSSGSGNSMASSRNLSGEGDFFFGANQDSSLTSLTSNDARYKSSPSSPRHAPKGLHMAPHASPRSAHKPLSSQRGSVSSSAGPLTPPPSPPFNARQAAAQCRAMDGYISFATIEGLGMPEGSDEEADEEAKSRSRWFQWLHISGKAGANERARDRSDSSSSASR